MESKFKKKRKPPGMLKKKLKKVMLTLIACLTLFTAFASNITNISAATVNITAEEATGYTHQGQACIGGYCAQFYGQSIDRLHLSDGRVGFCVEPWTLVNTTTGYNSTVEENTNISRIIYHGYLNAGQTLYDYAVTQLMIWEQYGYTPTSHTVTNYAARKAQIQALINSHGTRPSFNGGNYEIDLGETLSITDANGVIGQYSDWTATGCTVSVSGNTLNITPSVDTPDTVTIRGTKYRTRYLGASYMYRASGSQTIYSGMLGDPVPVTINLTVNKFGSLELTKYDDEALAVPGTQFTLSYNADMSDPIGTYTTADAGTVQIDDLRAGEVVYYQEVSVPAPLVLDSTIRNFTVVANEVVHRDVTNLIQKGIATLTKVDSETGATPQGDATFAGAVYELRAKENIVNPINNRVLYHAGDVVATRVMRADGTTDVVTDLYTGKYEWVEVEAPKGYLLTAGKIEVDLTYQGQNVTTITKNSTAMENVVKGKHQIFKTSTDGGSGILNGLKDAQFTYKLLSEVEKVGWDAATTYDVITTNDAGFAITKDLPYGTYLVKETFTPENKKTAPDFTITISENGKTYFNAINDAPFKSYVKLVKQDEDGKTVVLNSATFQIYDESGNAVIQKVGDKYIDKFTTDESGTVTTPLKLEAGIYTIDEIETPAGFLDLEQPVQFEITNRYNFDVDQDNDPVITVEIRNEKPTAEIVINKTFEDENDNGLGGATFKLTANSKIIDPADGSVIYNVGDEVNVDIATNGLYTVNETGTLTISNLPMSTGKASYKLVEVSTLDGYVVDATEYVFDFEMENLTQKVYTQTKDIENKQTVSAIAKTDVNNEPVVGSILQVLDENDTPVAEWTTAEETKVIKGLIVGKTYTIHELEAPTGYVIAKDVTFTVENTLDVQTFNMTDKQVSVLKTNAENGNALAGAEFIVTNNKTKQVVDHWTSTTDAHYISNLAEGLEYTITEVNAPDGYKKADPVIFTVSDSKETQSFTIDNKEIKISTTAFNEETGDKFFDALGTITVTDEVAYEALNVGQEYTMYGTIIDKETGNPLVIDGKEVKSQTTFTPTQENGTVEVSFTFNADSLAGKDLVVYEELTFSNDTEVIVEHKDINDEGQTVHVNRVANIQVNKVDSSNHKVVKNKDFEFTLFSNQECTQAVTKVNANTEDGTAIFENVKTGTWYIKETKAPLGYRLSNEVVKLEINDKGVYINGKEVNEEEDVYSFVYFNQMMPTIQTGDNTNTGLYVGLSCISLLGILTVAFRRKRNQER